MPFATLPLYFENAAGQVREHPAGYGVVTYKPGKREPGTFEALGTHLGRLLLDRQWQRFVSDQRLLAPLTEVEKEWTTTRWVNRHELRPAQLREAILVAGNAFTRLSLVQILNQTATVAGGITIQYFEQEDAAQRWLLSAVSF